MITAYKIVWTTKFSDRTEIDEEVYGWEKEAENRYRFLKRWTISEDTIEITETKIDSLPDQKIVVYGDQVGYQFSRTKMGKRTITRKIYHLQRVDDGLRGQAKFKDRVLTIEQESHLFDWEIVEVK